MSVTDMLLLATLFRARRAQHAGRTPRHRSGALRRGAPVLSILAALAGVAAPAAAQSVLEPSPRPPGAYLLRVTAQKPGIVGLACASTVAGPGLWDIVAFVPATKRGPFELADEARPPAVDYARPVFEAAPKAWLDVSDGSVTEAVPLFGQGVELVAHELERVRFRHVAIGRFGHAQIWLTARPGSGQIDVALNWHAGRWGGDSPGDVRFREARVRVPAGWRVVQALPDPAGDRGAVLVRDGAHVIPRQAERLFRFALVPEGAAYVAPWSTQGVSTGPVPVWRALPYCPPVNLAPQLATDRANLAGLVNPNGQAPVSPLWPAIGVQYGGMTSGEDMHPMFGVRWYATGQVAAIESALIEQLRYRARHRGALYGPDGGPVRPKAQLAAGGRAEWRMFNSVLEQAGPFGFPPRQVSVGGAASKLGPEVFDSIDAQHLVREQNHNWMLAYAGDHPARLFIAMEATKSLMTFWPGPGRAYRWPATTPGLGTDIGREYAWAAITIAHELAYGGSLARYAPFVTKYVGELEAAQMASGLFKYHPGAKESKKPPFAPDGTLTTDGTPLYVVASGLEECYHAAALYALAELDPRARALLERHAVGMERLAWVPGTPGVWSHAARGPAGSSERYVTREDWPASLQANMTSRCPTCPYNDAYHTGYAVGLYRLLGLEVPTLWRWWTGGQSPRAWGLSRGGTPIEQWWVAVQPGAPASEGLVR